MGWSSGWSMLPILPGHVRGSTSGISADGRVVVGVSYDADWNGAAVYWTAAGIVDIGHLTEGVGPSGGFSMAASADGSVIVGTSTNAADQYRAFRWTQAGGMVNLGTLGGNQSQAYAVSADGAVVVGMAKDAASHDRAFRWTQAGGMVDLGQLPGHAVNGPGLRASAVSADGTVVVGGDWTPLQTPFVWTAGGGGMVALAMTAETIAGGASATAISADGSIIVCESPNIPYLSTPGGLISLPIVADTWNQQAKTMSGDGIHVGGRFYYVDWTLDNINNNACLWTDSTAAIVVGSIPGITSILQINGFNTNGSIMAADGIVGSATLPLVFVTGQPVMLQQPVMLLGS